MDEPILVVIVNYRLARHIDRLLNSGALEGHRVLLVDNDSEPERVRETAEAHGAELLLLDRNFGFAGAVNRGIAHAGEHGPVLLLNPDVSVDAEDLARLRLELTARHVTGVTPLLVNLDGSLQVGTAGGPFTLRGFIGYFLFLGHVLPAARGVFFTPRQLVGEVPPRWACMACLMLDGAAFHRYGPLPEFELMYGEDVAWGWAASRAGASFAIASDVRVVHAQGAAGASWRWTGALRRLAVRELGPVRGRIAVAAMWAGLEIRRLTRPGARGRPIRAVRPG